MTAKEYLSQYRLLDTEINAKLEQVEQLRGKTVFISYISGGSSGTNSDKIGRTVAKLVDAENEAISLIDDLLTLKAKIENTIAAVENPVYRLILTLRYINCHELKLVAEEMHYSYKQIKRLHGEALLQIEL